MRKNIGVLAAMLAMAMSLGACGAGAGPGDDDVVTIGVALSDTSNPYFQIMATAIKEEAEKAGVEIIERSAPDGVDNDRFNQNVDSLVSQRVDAIITAPIGEANKQALQRAVDAGIPVVEVDSPIAGWGESIAQIQTDNKAAGAMAMEILLEGLKAEGKDPKVIIINNNLGYQSVIDRTAGAEEVVAEAGGELVKVVDGGVSQAEAQSVVETVLRANPQINGIMGTVAGYQLGAIQALRTTGKAGDILVTGVDGLEAEQKAIKAGTYYGAAGQQPAKIGVTALSTLLDALDGKDVERTVLIEPLKMTAANMAEWDK